MLIYHTWKRKLFKNKSARRTFSLVVKMMVKMPASRLWEIVVMVEVIVCLAPPWEDWIEFPSLGFSLAQSPLSQAFCK